MFGWTFTGKLNRIAYKDKTFVGKILSMLGMRDNYTTIGDTLYRPRKAGLSLEPSHLLWLNDNSLPLGINELEIQLYALLIHEATHSQQMGGNLFSALGWIFRYMTSKKFRLKVEKEAYAVQIITLKKFGEWLGERDAKTFAKYMSEDYSGMVSHADALQWITSLD